MTSTRRDPRRGSVTEPGTIEPALRRAGPDDAAAIETLVAAAYRPYTPLLGRTPMPMLTDYAIGVRERDVWILATGAAIVGVLDLVAHADHLWIDNLAIDPVWQGRGLGRRLLLHAEAEARARDLPEVRLLTNEHYHRNLAIYAAFGYRETHRAPHLGSDLVHFRKVIATGTP